jgi:hypothetical protein
MHHRIRPMFAKHPRHPCGIANIDVLETITRIIRNSG